MQRPLPAEPPRQQITVPVPNKHQVRHWTRNAIIVLIVLYLAYLVREIWLPLGLAFLLATVLDPVVDRMEARGFSRTVGAAIIFAAFLVVFVGGMILLIPAITHQASGIQEAFARYFPDTSPAGLRKSFERLNLPEAVANVAVRAYQSFVGGYAKTSTWLTDYGMSFLSNLVWVVIVPIVAFYALRDFHLILGKGLLLVPSRRRDAVQTYVAEVTAIFAKYLRGLLLVSAMNGVATTLLLLVLRVPSALLLGVIAGILYSVPYIGALLTIVLTAGVAFISGGPNYMLLVVGASMLLHQVVFDQIISPRVLGGQVGLHPILAIIALLSGNLLLGIIGMILAVPIAACIQIAVLAVVPKLSHEIEMNAEGQPVEVQDRIAAQTKDAQLETDATHDLHQTVVAAVEKVEQKIQTPGDPMDEATE